MVSADGKPFKVRDVLLAKSRSAFTVSRVQLLADIATYGQEQRLAEDSGAFHYFPLTVSHLLRLQSEQLSGRLEIWSSVLSSC